MENNQDGETRLAIQDKDLLSLFDETGDEQDQSTKSDRSLEVIKTQRGDVTPIYAKLKALEALHQTKRACEETKQEEEKTKQAELIYKKVQAESIEKTKQAKEMTTQSRHIVITNGARFSIAAIAGIVAILCHVNPVGVIGIIGAFFSPEIVRRMRENLDESKTTP